MLFAHFVFQICCSIKCPWLWVSSVQWKCPFHFMPAAENQGRTNTAPHWEVGEIHASQPFAVSSNWGEKVPCREPKCCSAEEILVVSILGTSSGKMSESFRRFNKHSSFNDWGLIRWWKKVGLLLSTKSDSGDDYAPYQLFGPLLYGLRELGWVRGSTVDASKADYQFFAQDHRQPERISTKTRPDLVNILSFWFSQAVFWARRHPYRVGNFALWSLFLFRDPLVFWVSDSADSTRC